MTLTCLYYPGGLYYPGWGAQGYVRVLVGLNIGDELVQESGLYESLVTELLQQKLAEIESSYFIATEELDPAEAATYLSRFLMSVLFTVLESIPKEGKLSRQIDLSNALIKWLATYLGSLHKFNISENLIDCKGQLLRALYETTNPVAADLKAYVKKITPITGLTQSELFTGSNVGLSLQTELKREILSADEIWWLVSFIRWSGIRVFEGELRSFTESGRKLKVITTSYMGATEIKAVNFLAGLPNTEVKLCYNSGQERLHAKSYIFRRNSGYHTGYIGSSNLSHSALTNGLEWNLKVTVKEIPHIIEKFQSTFETYWASTDFEKYNAGSEEDEKRLRKSLRNGQMAPADRAYQSLFDIEPHVYQKEILERLLTERNLHNRWRNLVVAATGTGKTVISAFDFRRFYRENRDAKLLFVSHREEILTQSLGTFRAVLREPSFGDLWVGKYKPEKYRHLFVSVQTLNSQGHELGLTEDYYDFIIIDEVHHIAAKSYRPILDYYEPKILLGLTATPERHDDEDILSDFCNTIAAELRLADAINQRHLCPFQYFAVDDVVDLSNVKWQGGRYQQTELTNLYTANDLRVKHILRNMEDILVDVHGIKCLAFCATQDHGSFMARKFNAAGVKSAVLTSKNSDERRVLRDQLVSGEINVLCVVDMFNEGVDIPEIDTVLFLRPTESLTIFLQQLGRGLRLPSSGYKKECLTVLDFVGNSRPEYDFASKFRGMVGKSQTSITDEIEMGFPHLPAGCSIVLSKKSQEIILRNIKSAIVNRNRLVQWIRTFQTNHSCRLTLKTFLKMNSTITLEDIYKPKIGSGGGWTRLCAIAGVTTDDIDASTEQAMFRGISNRLFQCSSASYLKFVLKLVRNGFNFDNQDAIEIQLASMVHWDFRQGPGSDFGFATLEDSIKALGKDSRLSKELEEVTTILLDRLGQIEMDLDIGEPSALKVHGRYNRDQILAAIGEHTFTKRKASREGVHYISGKNLELLFVTLQKSDKKFSPTTMYHDYAISETLFHWQSQNSARPEKGKGLSYINHQHDGKKIMLFVRESSKDEAGKTIGFINLGLVKLLSHNGSQPMNITWELETPLPPFLWREAAKLAVG